MTEEQLEQAREEIKGYLSRPSGGALIVDMNNKEVEWSTDEYAISWKDEKGHFNVVESQGAANYCSCENPFDEECDDCQTTLDYLIDKIKEELV